MTDCIDFLNQPSPPRDKEERRAWCLQQIRHIQQRHRQEMEVECKPYLDMLGLLAHPISIQPKET